MKFRNFLHSFPFYDTIAMPNKLNNGTSVVSLADAMLICATHLIEFAKNANPGGGYAGFTAPFHFNLFGDNRGCVFQVR